jgi:hypothetical protein
MKTKHIAFLILAGLIFFSSAKAELKWLATSLGGCNETALRAGENPLENDTVIISTVADTLNVFVGRNYICSAPFRADCEIRNDSIFMHITDTCKNPPACYDRCECYYTFDFQFAGQGDKNYPYKIVLSDPREDEPQTISEGKIVASSPLKVSEVLLLKVDYTTNQLEGGQKLNFTQLPETFTARIEYEEPCDFGWVKVYFAEKNELLFHGDIVWAGRGDIIYPAIWLNANEFEYVLTEDYIVPVNGFENIFNPWEGEYDYTSAWGAVQGIVEVRKMLRSNPQQIVKLFLYTPSVGFGYPEDWKWIIFLAGENLPTSFSEMRANGSGSELFQNYPNPFKNETTIRYALPAGVASAEIQLCDFSGKLLKRQVVDPSGTVFLKSSELGAGVYFYSLVIAGKTVATKQMIIIK